jgi:hypothetical protein
MDIVMSDVNTNSRLDSIENRLNSIESTLQSVTQNFHKLYVAVVGDEKFHQEGIVHRIKDLELEVDKLTKIRLKLAGIFIGSGAVWAIVWEFLRKFIVK